MQRFFQIMMVAGAASLTSCGGIDDAPVTVKIKGEVTYNGQALPDGEIIFRATGGGGKSISAQIKEGQYEVDCTLGTKRVEITAMREQKGAGTEKLETGETGPVLEPYIPEEYNDKSTLTAEITESGETKFDYALKGK